MHAGKKRENVRCLSDRTIIASSGFTWRTKFNRFHLSRSSSRVALLSDSDYYPVSITLRLFLEETLILNTLFINIFNFLLISMLLKIDL